MKFIEHPLAHRWCRGEGLEIGAAAHNPVGLRTRNVALHEAFYDQAQVDMCGEVAPIDIEASADEIPLDNASQDFIVSSHVVEHLPNLVRALVEWDRLLKPGGICFITVARGRMVVRGLELVMDQDRSHFVHEQVWLCTPLGKGPNDVVAYAPVTAPSPPSGPLRE